jgi:hypothetical protein
MKRIAELAVNKIDQAVKMVAGAIIQGFVPQYVLADSCFITDGFIKSIVELGAKRKQRVEVLGLMKSGRNVQYQGKTYNTDIMPKIFESKTKACRKMKCRYLALNVVSYITLCNNIISSHLNISLTRLLSSALAASLIF